MSSELLNRRRFLRGGSAALASLAFATTGIADSSDAAPKREVYSPEDRPDLEIIDVHCHAGRGAEYGTADPDVPQWKRWNDPQAVLEGAAEAGIHKCVIFPIHNDTYEEANAEIAGYVRQYPDRFIGFAKHDPKTEKGRIRTMLLHEVSVLGLKGLKLHAVPTPEIMDSVLELGIPIIMHPRRVGDSLPVVEDHPEVNFILAHLGSYQSKIPAEHALAIQAARRYPNLHLETSAVSKLSFLEKAAREVPPNQLLFGSDGPGNHMKGELQKVLDLNVAKHRKRMVLSGNARRLIGLE